jgi:hypothetical protein
VDGIVPFAGTVLSTCLIVAGVPGVLTPSSDFSSMTSAGGISGTAVITATGAFNISALAPAAFLTGGTGANTNTTFEANYSLTGATSVSDVLGATPTALDPGITTISVDLTATKSSGAFLTGAYTANVTVRCEP